MRLIAVDEAGISDGEPITVVSAIVVEADIQSVLVRHAIGEVLNAVPERLQGSFKFSAKSVFSESSTFEIWSPTDRLRLLKSILEIPRRFGLPIIVSTYWAGNTQTYFDNLSDAQNDHLHAFVTMLSMADRAVRDIGNPLEQAMLIVERAPGLAKPMADLLRACLKQRFVISPDLIRRTDKDAQFLTQSGDIRVERIRNAIAFVEKTDEPLTYLADAISFTVRRYLCGLDMGSDLALALTGAPGRLDRFASPGGTEIYYTAPPAIPTLDVGASA